MTLPQLEDLLRRIYAEQQPPKPLHLLPALKEVQAGGRVGDAARRVRTTAANLRQLVDATDPLSHLLGEPAPDHGAKAEKVRATIGQLIIGALAEQVFEDTYRRTVGSTELTLEDDRSGVATPITSSATVAEDRFFASTSNSTARFFAARRNWSI